MSDFVYPNDQPVVRLDSQKAFEALTNKEKLYAHYLSRASWYGGLIVLLQTSQESPLIYVLLQLLFKHQSIESLKEIAIQHCGLSNTEFQAILVYACGIYTDMGNYKGFGDTKFVPNLPKENFEKVVLSSQAHEKEPILVETLWKNCSVKMYSLDDREKQLGLGTKGTTTYFSSNCDEKDSSIVKHFMKEKSIEAYNSRVFKKEKNGVTTFEIRLASVDESTEDSNKNVSILGTHVSSNGDHFEVTRGDYSKLLEHVALNLTEAKKHAANDNEAQMVENYICSFRTGSLDAHKEGSRFWIKDKGPIVETYIGFIETYRDPSGMRGEFEGFVAMVNKAMSKKFAELVDKAEQFLPLMPWPKTYEKDRFLRPDFTSLDVLTFAGSGIPAGICIPNYDEIRQNEGFKNVSLGNVIPASYKDSAPNYLGPKDQELISKYRVGSFEVQVGLHELLGHGSGKMFTETKDGKFNFEKSEVLHTETKEKITSWYEDGESYDSVFSSLGSAYEECRAECVGLFLSTEKDVLKIFGFEGQEADEALYVNWLSLVHRAIEGLQMYEPKSGTWLQAHSQARYAIMQVLLEAGENFVKVQRLDGEDGQPDLLLTMDATKIHSIGKPAVGDFLRKLQVYKATADIKSARAMFEKYSTVDEDTTNPFLKHREIVMARKKPRKMFVQDNSILKNNKVVLKSYDASHEGLIQSWSDRFSEKEVREILEGLWRKDHAHHKF